MSLGEVGAQGVSRAGRAGGWRRSARTTIVARQFESEATVTAASYPRRRRVARWRHAPPGVTVEKALAYAEDKPTQFARAQLLDEAEPARRGRTDTAVRAMQDAIYDEATTSGGGGCATRTRAAATRRRAGPRRGRWRATTWPTKRPGQGSSNRRAALRRWSIGRGAWRIGPRVGAARDRGRGRRRVVTLAVEARRGYGSRRGLEARRSARSASAAGRRRRGC